MHRVGNSTIKLFLFATAVFILAFVAGVAQTPPNASSGNAADIVPFLNQTIAWHGQLKGQQQIVSEPSDVLFLNDSRQIADQVVRLSFDFARAQTPALAAANKNNAGEAAAGAASFQGLTDSAAKADAQVKGLQKELEGFRQQLATATGKKRTTLQATISETEGELELFQARKDILHTMVEFAHGTTAGGLGQLSLSAQIEELAKTVPAENSRTDASQSGGSTSVPAAAKERKTAPTGILGLITDLFALRQKLRTLDDDLQQTDSMAQAAKALRAPMV